MGPGLCRLQRAPNRHPEHRLAHLRSVAAERHGGACEGLLRVPHSVGAGDRAVYVSPLQRPSVFKPSVSNCKMLAHRRGAAVGPTTVALGIGDPGSLSLRLDSNRLKTAGVARGAATKSTLATVRPCRARCGEKGYHNEVELADGVGLTGRRRRSLHDVLLGTHFGNCAVDLLDGHLNRRAPRWIAANRSRAKEVDRRRVPGRARGGGGCNVTLPVDEPCA